MSGFHERRYPTVVLLEILDGGAVRVVCSDSAGTQLEYHAHPDQVPAFGAKVVVSIRDDA